MITEISNASKRLTAEGITFKQMYQKSYKFYKLKKGDNKDLRMRMDVTSAKITARKKLEYDRSEKKWIQTGRDIKVEFLVSSEPISYKKRDSINVHKFPVTFIIHDIDKGINSTFKYRSGSLFKPRFSKKGMSSQQRQAIENYNLKKGIDLWFFFHLEWVLRQENVLYGVNYAKYKPKETNPKSYIYFEKHSLFCFKRILFPLLTTRKQLLKRVLNEERENFLKK